MNADDIHAQLDAATRDHTVSPDAMRCGPAPDDEATEPIREAMRPAVAAMRPATETAARALRQLAEAARAAAASTPDDFALAPPQLSRPADWTPCGPKPRRRP